MFFIIGKVVINKVEKDKLNFKKQIKTILI